MEKIPMQDLDHPTIARFSCRPCREAKRKCDRQTPRCQLCENKNEECVYPLKRKRREFRAHAIQASEQLPSPNSDVVTVSSPAGSAPGTAASALLTEFFIDPELFRYSRLELPHPDSSFLISSQIQYEVGDTASIQAIARHFFKTVHTWLPILDKRSFPQLLLSRLTQKKAETYLLVLAMKLLASTPSEPVCNLYSLTKQLHGRIIDNGVMSLMVTQAGILITMYELGHGIYPATYMSIAQCARYATAQGIQKTLTSHSSEPGYDLEETRRAWWSILLLDRLADMCDPGRHIVTPDPETNSYLPIDDADWDAGAATPLNAFTLANASSLALGRFARLAQAAHLLARVMQHVAEGSQDTAQLRRTIYSLVHVSRIESEARRLEFCTQMAACYSGILLLDYPNSVDARGVFKGSGMALSEETTSILAAGLKLADKFSGSFVANFQDYMSPFLVHLCYKMASVCTTLSASGDTPEFINTGRIAIKDTLEQLSPRWHVARSYGVLLSRREMLIQL